MFSNNIKDIGILDLDLINTQSLTMRIRYCHIIIEELCRRFKNKYLGQLIVAANKTRKINKIVLVGNNNLKRIYCSSAFVEDVIPGRYDEIRRVKLKTIRPLLYTDQHRKFIH